MKAQPGRGRKRADWVDALHMNLKDEFDWLRKLGVKFNLTNLRVLALELLHDSQNAAYSMNMVDPLSKLPLHMKTDASGKIDASWIN